MSIDVKKDCENCYNIDLILSDGQPHCGAFRNRNGVLDYHERDYEDIEQKGFGYREDEIAEKINPLLSENHKKVLSKYKITEHKDLKTVRKSHVTDGMKWHLCGGETIDKSCFNLEHSTLDFLWFNISTKNKETRVIQKIFIYLRVLDWGWQYIKNDMIDKNEIRISFNDPELLYTNDDAKKNSIIFIRTNKYKIEKLFDLNLTEDQILNIIEELYA